MGWQPAKTVPTRRPCSAPPALLRFVLGSVVAGDVDRHVAAAREQQSGAAERDKTTNSSMFCANSGACDSPWPVCVKKRGVGWRAPSHPNRSFCARLVDFTVTQRWPSSAHAARRWSQHVLYMINSLPLLGGAVRTQIARVRLLAGVRALVPDDRRHLTSSKSAPGKATRERPFAGVRSLVHHEHSSLMRFVIAVPAFEPLVEFFWPSSGRWL